METPSSKSSLATMRRKSKNKSYCTKMVERWTGWVPVDTGKPWADSRPTYFMIWHFLICSPKLPS